MPAVSGTVKDANGNFARRLVRVHRRDTGALVGETLSNPSTGAFSVTTADYSKHYAVAHDSDAWITYLPFNGDNGSTSFPEWGGKTVTAYGNAQISTAQAKFGGSSAKFDGNGDYLSIPATTEFNFGTSAFTVEAWVYIAADSAANFDGARDAVIFEANYPSSGAISNAWAFLVTGNSSVTGTGLAFFAIDGSTQKSVVASASITKGAWHHVAASRQQGGNVSLFLDGVLLTAGANTIGTTGNVNCGAVNPNRIGSLGFANYPDELNGHIDDLRISKGVARYITNFTPPTAPHFTVQDGDPWWGNVVLGCHFNGYPDNGDAYRHNVVLNMRMNGANGSTAFVDDCGKTVTANGNVAISTAQSKFGGASAYFDGTGDYLTLQAGADFAFDTGDFTIEMWVRQVSLTGQQTLIRSGANATGAWFAELVAGKLNFYTWSGGFVVLLLDTTATVNANQWYHLAIVRSGNNYVLYRDGVSVATGSSTASLSLAGSVWVGSGLGSGDTHGNYFNGYIDDLRITKGVARYTGSFTPPTAEIPTITAPLFKDSATGKTITAVGNAAISTAQSKFGGASAYCDGSGDGLTCAASADFGMGTGDFTIEAWIYATSVGGGSARVIVDLRNAIGAGGGGLFYIHESTGKLAFVDGTSTIGNSGTVVTTNTWHHVAASRAGGVLRLFLDGVLDASGTMTTNLGSSQVCGVGCSAVSGSVGSYSLAGYVDDLRITKGVARYIANFTPPAAAFPEQLLTFGQKNAMIYDHLTPV